VSHSADGALRLAQGAIDAAAKTLRPPGNEACTVCPGAGSFVGPTQFHDALPQLGA